MALLKPLKESKQQVCRLSPEIFQFCLCIAQNYALPNQCIRFLSRINQSGSFFYLILTNFGNRYITSNKRARFVIEFNFLNLVHFWQNLKLPVRDDHCVQYKKHGQQPTQHLQPYGSDKPILLLVV